MGCIQVGGVVRKASYCVASGDTIAVEPSPQPPSDLVPENIPLDLIFEDEDLIVINKSDQAQQCDTAGLAGFEHRVAVSAKYNQGLAELGEAIVRHLAEDSSLAGNEGVIITERRHRDALLNGIVALDRLFASTVSAAPRECLAMDLREALGALGRITGETTPDEILEQIFSRFCIGK